MTYTQSKWAEIMTGARVVMSDRTLDELAESFKDSDGREASLYFRCLRTIPNPKRVGTLDTYLAWIDAEDLK